MRTIYLVLGSIGSGKSTFSDFLSSTKDLEKIEYVGVDIFKKKYFDLNILQSSRGYRCADELVFKRIEQICSEGKDFIFELCPTNLNKLRTLKIICKQAKYNVISFFIGTSDVQINIARCKKREKLGADVVDESKIYRRYFDTMRNILELIKLSEIMYFIDNSNSIPRVIGYAKRSTICMIDKTCQWFKDHIVDKLVHKH
jgi:predicted ABC-type ATPase